MFKFVVVILRAFMFLLRFFAFVLRGLPIRACFDFCCFYTCFHIGLSLFGRKSANSAKHPEPSTVIYKYIYIYIYYICISNIYIYKVCYIIYQGNTYYANIQPPHPPPPWGWGDGCMCVYYMFRCIFYIKYNIKLLYINGIYLYIYIIIENIEVQTS